MAKSKQQVFKTEQILLYEIIITGSDNGRDPCWKCCRICTTQKELRYRCCVRPGETLAGQERVTATCGLLQMWFHPD